MRQGGRREPTAGRRVDGVFLDELTVDDPRVDLVRELDLPAVGVNPAAGFPLPAVRQDDSAGIGELVGYLGKFTNQNRKLILVNPSERMWSAPASRAPTS